jgi:hypothetical protein
MLVLSNCLSVICMLMFLLGQSSLGSSSFCSYFALLELQQCWQAEAGGLMQLQPHQVARLATLAVRQRLQQGSSSTPMTSEVMLPCCSNTNNSNTLTAAAATAAVAIV